jgi:hypothetical protein
VHPRIGDHRLSGRGKTAENPLRYAWSASLAPATAYRADARKRAPKLRLVNDISSLELFPVRCEARRNCGAIATRMMERAGGAGTVFSGGANGPFFSRQRTPPRGLQSARGSAASSAAAQRSKRSNDASNTSIG